MSRVVRKAKHSPTVLTVYIVITNVCSEEYGLIYNELRCSCNKHETEDCTASPTNKTDEIQKGSLLLGNKNIQLPSSKN